MHSSEPIELYDWTGCNLFYANYLVIIVGFKREKVGVSVIEVVAPKWPQ